MNLPKAIEILESDISEDIPAGEIQHIDATRLGIEALKREASWRYRFPHQSHLPFPGETKE